MILRHKAQHQIWSLHKRVQQSHQMTIK